MLSFTPRLEVTHRGVTLGFLTLPKHNGAVLPRIGEFVFLSLHQDTFDPQRFLQLGPADKPTVTRVEHYVGTDDSPEYTVVIRVSTLRSASDLTSLGDHAGSWTAS